MKLLSQVALGVAVAATLLCGVFLLLRGSTGGGLEIVLPTPAAESRSELKVYITGAVANPGVYDALEGNRLEHVVGAAGGTTDTADLAAVNLAVRVQDEQHWHIPRVGETARPAQSTNVDEQRRIDLNVATVDDLKTLPGIGDVKAQAIVTYRTDNGPFQTIDSIVGVQGIGPATLASIRDLVEVR